MTTIAWDGVTLASDSLCSDGLSRLGSVKKIWRMRNGTLLAGAGDAGAVQAWLKWMRSGRKGARPAYTDCTLIQVLGPRRVVCWDVAEPLEIECDLYAFGSGGNFAMGAMSAGVGAAEAVRTAIRHDAGSGGPIQTLRLKT